MSLITHDDFRKAGMTGGAINYPLSPEALEWKRNFNGVPDGYKAPETFAYASNSYMQKYMHERAIAEAIKPLVFPDQAAP